VLISPDGRFVFVTLQNSGEMAVFNLAAALGRGFGPGDFIGYIPLAAQPVGMSIHGSWLYVVSLTGKLAVVNLSEAEADPRRSVVTTVRAGCGLLVSSSPATARSSGSRPGKVMPCSGSALMRCGRIQSMR